MRVARMRLRLWLFLAGTAAALQTLSLYVATLPVYVNRLSGIQYCPTANCVTLEFNWVPTHPYVWLGIGIYAGGAAVMGLALFLLRRAPQQPRPKTAPA